MKSRGHPKLTCLLQDDCHLIKPEETSNEVWLARQTHSNHKVHQYMNFLRKRQEKSLCLSHANPLVRTQRIWQLFKKMLLNATLQYMRLVLITVQVVLPTNYCWVVYLAPGVLILCLGDDTIQGWKEWGILSKYLPSIKELCACGSRIASLTHSTDTPLSKPILITNEDSIDGWFCIATGLDSPSATAS